MGRVITPFVADKLKQWEGLRLTAYKDSGGVLTIGYGHTGPDVKAGMTITEAQAEMLLMRDLSRFEQSVERSVKVPLTDNQFGALVSFAYNVGTSAFEGSTLLKKLNAGDYSSVPSQLARWNKVGGKVLAGLTNRRAAEAGLWATGNFVSSADVQAKPDVPPIISKENALALGAVIAGAGSASTPDGPYHWGMIIIIGLIALAIAYLVIKSRKDG